MHDHYQLSKKCDIKNAAPLMTMTTEGKGKEENGHSQMGFLTRSIWPNF
jgi:hypothetical protein